MQIPLCGVNFLYILHRHLWVSSCMKWTCSRIQSSYVNLRPSQLNFAFWCTEKLKRMWPRLGGLPHLETFTWQIVTPADRVTLPGRPGNPPRRVNHLSCKRDWNKIRNYMDRRVTSPTWGPPPTCKQALKMKVRNCARQGVTTYFLF